MKSEKGMNLLGLVVLIAVLMMIAGVSVYVLVGPNGQLNREEVKPLVEDSSTVENQVM